MTSVPSADPSGHDPLLIRLPAKPASLAVIRARLRRWLLTAAVSPAAAAELLLAVGEATSNAVEHATRDVRHDVEVEVSAQATAAGLEVTVKDNGRWRAPPNRPGTRGHGSKLMTALVDTITITPTPNGTTVEMRKELHP